MPGSASLHVADARVLMRDGVALATDVTVADDGRRHPVLLLRTPYGRGSLRVGHDPVALARDGWAVVVQDVRGRFDSAGEFVPFHQERADGADTVAWCANQPWSNGQVVMTGASYNGATQWLAAAERPAALRAISPMVSTAEYRDHWCYEGGAVQYGFLTGWSLGLAASRPGQSLRQAIALHRELYRWPGPRRGPAAEEQLAALAPGYRQWTGAGGPDYWRPIDVARTFARLDVAAYHVAGWYDIFCEGSLAAYVGMTERAATDYARRSQRLVVGPWVHAAVYFPSTPEVDFGPAANGILRGIPAEQLKFLRRAAERREVPTGASVFVMGRNRWLELARWPPAAVATEWYLGADTGAASLAGDGRLTPAPAPHAGVDRYRHDPADPVPTRGGRTLSPGLPGPGPMDQRPVERRQDVLVYTSDPLARELTVVGAVRAMLRFASSAPVADVTVKLVDVHPDGAAVGIVDSIRRVSRPPGRAGLVEVAVGSTAMTFRRGHRIRLEVASANFPRFDAAPAGDQAVYHGGRSGSRLILPVFPVP